MANAYEGIGHARRANSSLPFHHGGWRGLGELKPHRDGTRSIYLANAAGNAAELLDTDSVTSAATS